MPRLVDMTGARVGRLTVESRDGRDRHGQAMWLCVCDCGDRLRVRGQALRRGTSTSCGCSRRRTSSRYLAAWSVWYGIGAAAEERRLAERHLRRRWMQASDYRIPGSDYLHESAEELKSGVHTRGWRPREES